MPKTLPKPPWLLDSWDSPSGQVMEIIDHKHCVEVAAHGGESIRLTEDDALHVYANLEKWLASKAQPVGSN